MKNTKLAKKILAENTDQEAVYITEDGQAFFSKNKAVNHCYNRKFEEEPEAFFREGFEPQDDKDLQEAFTELYEKTEVQDQILARVNAALDMSQEAEEITDDTPDMLAGILAMREQVEKQNDDYAEAIKEKDLAVKKISELESDLKKANKDLDSSNKEAEKLSAELSKLKETPVVATEEKATKKTTKKTK